MCLYFLIMTALLSASWLEGLPTMPKTLVLFSTSYHDWAKGVDHKTRIQEVVGSIPAGCWAFYFFFPFLRSLVEISSKSLFRSLKEVYFYYYYKVK